jgi:glucuronoarabinoxylan endo-1,4-beta-xylanase
MSDPILNDSVACANTDIVCGHIYGDGLAPYPLAEEKGKEVWMTEHLSGENNSANEWDWALPVAREINDVMRADMSAYVWWYLVRYYGPIDDGSFDIRSRKGTVTKKGYVMSQFSRFIRPGYYRVDSRSWPPTGSPYVTAYKDSTSSRAVIVAINSGSTPLELIIQIKYGFANTFTPYTTSENKNVVQDENVEVSDHRLIYTMEASSITTFVSE